jgi:hypothetical protein
VIVPVAVLVIGGGVGACGLTLLVQYLLKRRSPSAPSEEEEEPEPVLVERWNPETVRLAYEQARELERTLDAWGDSIDRKAATIYGAASIVAGLSSMLGHSENAVAHGLWAAALVVWVLTTVAFWFSFKPRSYSLHPDPRRMLTAKWLALDPGSFYLRRLRQVTKSYAKNEPVIDRKAKALTWAAALATLEVVLLLAALWAAARA